MTNQEIADASGLTVARVARISKLWSWSTIQVGQAEDFRKACGVTHLSERRQFAYLKRTYTTSKTALCHLELLPPKMLKRLSKGMER